MGYYANNALIEVIYKIKEKLQGTRNKQLDAIVQRIEMNVSNNYKDAAQLNLKEFETLFGALSESGKLNDSQKAYYSEKLSDFKQQMKNFTHKDQKPTWV